MKKQKITWQETIAVVAIFVLAFGLRWRAGFKYPLAWDFAVHWQESLPLAQGTGVVLAGATASMNTSFRQGPFYYYFLALLQIISNYNDRIVVVLFAFVNTLTLIPLYFLARKFLSKEITYLIMLVFAIGSYWVWVGGSPWNPNVIPFLTTVALYLSWLIKYEHKTCWLPSLFILLSWIAQSHLVTLPIILFLVWFSFDCKTWFQSWKLYLIGVGLFLLTWLPYIVYLIQENWQPLISLLSIRAGDNGSCTFSWWLQNHGHGETCFHWIRNSLFVFRTLGVGMFGVNSIVLAVAAGLVTILFAYFSLWGKHFRLVIIVPLTVVLYLFYKSNVYLHYFVYLLPFGLLFLGGVIDRVKKSLILFFT